MGRRDRETGGELPRTYEGEAILSELLALAGSAATAAEVKELFREALAAHETPATTFPELFEGEPRFPSPDIARRLYGNLFGLWDRVARGVLEEPRVREEKPPPPEMVPPPPPLEVAVVTDEFVEAAFKSLTTIPEKERQRQKDRFEQRESEWVELIRRLGLQPMSEEAALECAFELWLVCGWALGPKLGRTDFTRLRSPAPKGTQPALDRFIADWLGEAELDEDEPMTPEDRQKAEPLLRAAAELLAPVPAAG